MLRQYSSIISLNPHHIDTLLQHLPSPYITSGDVNGHNVIWGDKTMISGVNLLNISQRRMTDKSNTYFHPGAKSFNSVYI